MGADCRPAVHATAVGGRWLAINTQQRCTQARCPLWHTHHRHALPSPPACLPALQAKFRVNQHCKVLCRIGSLNKAQEKAFKSRISDEYRVNM